jgi:prevent-host-death family protein
MALMAGSTSKRVKSGLGALTVKATDAKNRFGVIMKNAKNGPVFIEKHGTPNVVVLSMTAYQDLLRKGDLAHHTELDALRQEFEAMYAAMQTKEARDAVDALLSATGEELNRAARKRSKRRG